MGESNQHTENQNRGDQPDSVQNELSKLEFWRGKLHFKDVEILRYDSELSGDVPLRKIKDYYQKEQGRRYMARLSNAKQGHHSHMSLQSAAIAIKNACDLRHEIVDAGDAIGTNEYPILMMNDLVYSFSKSAWRCHRQEWDEFKKRSFQDSNSKNCSLLTLLTGLEHIEK